MLLRLGESLTPGGARISYRCIESGAAGVGLTSPLLRLQFFHHTRDQLLGVDQALGNELNVHCRLTKLPRALAINAVLANQHQRVGDEIEGDCEPAPLLAHHEFKFFQVVLAFEIYGHRIAIVPPARLLYVCPFDIRGRATENLEPPSEEVWTSIDALCC